MPVHRAAAYDTAGFLKWFHAVTLHAVLVLPALAWVLGRSDRSASERTGIVRAAAVAYVVLAVLVLVTSVVVTLGDCTHRKLASAVRASPSRSRTSGTTPIHVCLADLAALAERCAAWDAVFCWDHLSRKGEPATDPAGRPGRDGDRDRARAAGRHGHAARPATAGQGGARDRGAGSPLATAGSSSGWGSEPTTTRSSRPSTTRPTGSSAAQMLDEALDVVTALWTGEPVDHARPALPGATAAGFRPTPVQQPRIPIWVAGTWPARPAFRRAARYDGLFPTFRDLDAPDNVHLTLAEAVAYSVAHRDVPCPARRRDRGHSPVAGPAGRLRGSRSHLVGGDDRLVPQGRRTRCGCVVAAGPPSA